MQSTNDISQQFAHFFPGEILKGYAQQVFRKLSEGHVCLDLTSASSQQLDELARQPFISTQTSDRQPFILHNNRLYLQRYFYYETTILDRIIRFSVSDKGQFEERVTQLRNSSLHLNSLFAEHSNVTGTNWQKVAVVSGVLNDLTIITGGPGTGKTTTVARILALLLTIEPELKIALAAPTGKAAARMSESLKSAAERLDENIRQKFQSLQPSTIHRLLRTAPGESSSYYTSAHPINADVVIIDEGSMIDVSLFAKLLDAIGDNTRLIILGDKDQLASVEAGSLFGDLCQAAGDLNKFSQRRVNIINELLDTSERISDTDRAETSNPLFEHVIELRHSHRFTGDESIGRFSKAVINNDQQSLLQFFHTPGDGKVVTDTNYNDEVFREFISGYAEFIGERDPLEALRKFNKLRVLCAIREGDQGLSSVNRAIEKLLHQMRLLNPSGDYYENRPIIVTRNYYNLGLFNGDIGIIRADEKGVMRAYFDDGNESPKTVLPGYLSHMETVFAMTIHKSQGSEFERVLVLLPNADNIPILTSELLYTAITRAREKVVLQASQYSVLQAAAKRVERGSGIIDRLKMQTIN